MSYRWRAWSTRQALPLERRPGASLSCTGLRVSSAVITVTGSPSLTTRPGRSRRSQELLAAQLIEGQSRVCVGRLGHDEVPYGTPH